MGVAGPGIAALLLLAFSWPAIFIINIPIAIFAFFIGSKAMPGPAQDAAASRVDARGVALVTVFTFGLLTALSSLTIYSIVGVVVALVALGAYLAHARRVPSPVLRVRHLTDPSFRGLHAIAFFVTTGGVTAHAFLPIYVKGGRSGSTALAAFSILFLTIGWTSGSFLASRRADRQRILAVIHEFAIILFLAVALLVPMVLLDAPLWLIFIGYVPVGMGIGGVSSSGVAAVQRSAMPAEMGRVNSAHQFVRTLGFSSGAALSGLALFGIVEQRLGSAETVRGLLGDDESVGVDLAASEAIRLGYGATLMIAVVVAACGAAVSTQVRRSRYVGIGGAER